MASEPMSIPLTMTVAKPHELTATAAAPTPSGFTSLESVLTPAATSARYPRPLVLLLSGEDSLSEAPSTVQVTIEGSLRLLSPLAWTTLSESGQQLSLE